MNPDMIIGEVISSALGVRHGRRHRHHPFDLIVGGHPWWLNGGTLMTALGIAWGMLDTANAAPVQTGPSTVTMAASPPAATATTVRSEPTPAAPTVPVDVARVIRLTVSAARADGALTDVEQDAIRTRARAVGAEPLVDAELKTPTPLSRLVAGVPDTSRSELYTLAFAIVHADGVIAGAERIYLAQLAHALGLSVDDAASLEQTAAQRLNAPAPASDAKGQDATDAATPDQPAASPEVS
jgi:uncharacterized membrane protein YebE (DUF533 family)